MKLGAYKNPVVKAVALYVNSFCSTVASEATKFTRLSSHIGREQGMQARG